jgi:hypothetical protein
MHLCFLLAFAELDRNGGAGGLVWIGYLADAHRRSHTDLFQEKDYEVKRPHVTGGIPGDALASHVAISPGAPVQRAFDVNLDCVARILAGCKDAGELAPSAWADYQRK